MGRVSGRAGGGLTKAIELLPGEEIVAQTMAYKKFFLPSWTSWGGTLLLTTQRLIYLPTWLFIPSWPEKPDAILLSDIRAVERVAKPWYYMFLWGGFGKTVWWIFRTDEREVRFGNLDDAFDEHLGQLAAAKGWK